MSQPSKMLRQLFVKPFYTENAGVFMLVFTMMFVIVGSTHGYGLYAYHHSLAVGMLSNGGFLLGVFFLWFLYARKYISHVATTMRQPEFAFIYIFNQLSKTRLFILFLAVEIWLLLPIILYAFFVLIIGVEQHYYLSSAFIIAYLFAVCFAGAALHVRALSNLDKINNYATQKAITQKGFSTNYVGILLHFIIKQQKAILLGTKIFTCGILYLIARNNNATFYDSSLPFLFFNFGILANGVIIYKLKIFEETYLSFYRSLPVSLGKRLLQYSLLYAVLLVPEFVAATMLAPVHLHTQEAISFSLSAFSVLLLINAIASVQHFGKKEFAAILLLLFAVQYIFMLALGFVALYVFFLLLATSLFFFRFYKFDGAITG